ncbi:MAG: DMT family transporter [Methylobacteriaceae bacterium]|nr:DMT family transporter [Methylobacteriaceae bacterium]
MSKTGDHFLTARSSGLFWLAVTILIWGAYMPVGKVVSQAIDPYWITAIRYLFSGLFLTIVVSAVEGPAALVPPRKDVFGLILLGALGSAGFGLFSYLGVRLTRPEHAAAITVLTPINVAIWRALEARALPPRGVVLAAIAVVFGALLVVTRGDLSALTSGGSMIGNLLVFVSSLCWTFYTIKAQTMAGYSALRLTALTCLMGSPVGLTLAAVMTALGYATAPHFADFLPIWPQIVYLFIFVSAVSIITWNLAVRLVGAQTATLVSTFTPVIPFAWAAWGGRVFTLWEIVGVAVIMAAILAHNLNEQRKTRALAAREATA